jgi:hypothetical protein
MFGALSPGRSRRVMMVMVVVVPERAYLLYARVTLMTTKEMLSITSCFFTCRYPGIVHFFHRSLGDENSSAFWEKKWSEGSRAIISAVIFLQILCLVVGTKAMVADYLLLDGNAG